MMHHDRPKVITTGENHLHERTIGELLADSPQLVELLADGDHARLSGGTIRRATQVSDLLDGGPR